MRISLSRNVRAARATAPPAITMLREANVPKPKALISVSRGPNPITAHWRDPVGSLPTVLTPSLPLP
jgi:hypothetical protein